MQLAWFKVGSVSATANNTTAATLTTGEASVGGVELNAAITYASNVNLMLTDTSGNAKIWNGTQLVEATYGAKYIQCTVTLSAKTGQNYSQMGTATYYLTISNSQERVRINHALTSDTYVGASESLVAAFDFQGKAGFDSVSTTFYLAVIQSILRQLIMQSKSILQSR